LNGWSTTLSYLKVHVRAQKSVCPCCHDFLGSHFI